MLTLVLYRGKSWKIADFGLARSGTSTIAISTQGAGTLGYKAPELIGIEPNYTKKADLWAFGCIIAELLCGKKPFENDNEVRAYAYLKGTKKRFWSNLTNKSPEVESVTRYYVGDLLQPDPSQRPRSREVLLRTFKTKALPHLEHEWNGELQPLSKLLIETIDWAIKASQTEVESLLAAATRQSVICESLGGAINKHETLHQPRPDFNDPETVFQYFKAAVASSEMFTLLALLKYVAHQVTLNPVYKNSVEKYFPLWAANPKTLIRSELLDCSNKFNREVMKCLLFRPVGDDVSREVATLLSRHENCECGTKHLGDNQCDGWEVFSDSNVDNGFEVIPFCKIPSPEQACLNMDGTLLACCRLGTNALCTTFYKIERDKTEIIEKKLSYNTGEWNGLWKIGFAAGIYYTAVWQELEEVVLYSANVDPSPGALSTKIIKFSVQLGKRKRILPSRYLEFSPKGTYLMTLSETDTILRLWNCKTGYQELAISTQLPDIPKIVLSNNEAYIAAWSGQTVRIWGTSVLRPASIRTPPLREIDLTKDFPNGIADIAFRPSSDSLFILSSAGNIKLIWNCAQSLGTTTIDLMESKERVDTLTIDHKRRLMFGPDASAVLISKDMARLYNIERDKTRCQAIMLKPKEVLGCIFKHVVRLTGQVP